MAFPVQAGQNNITYLFITIDSFVSLLLLASIFDHPPEYYGRYIIPIFGNL